MKRDAMQGAGHGRDRRTAGHAQEDHVIDPYLARAKRQGPARCSGCGAVFQAGRWQWAGAPGAEAPGAEEALCPACERARDDYPAGVVTLGGAFLAAHRDEILGLIRHQEALEKGEHPLNRILSLREIEGGLEIATADIHLPRRLGEALHRAYGGELDYRYEPERYFLRVAWSRDA